MGINTTRVEGCGLPNTSGGSKTSEGKDWQQEVSVETSAVDSDRLSTTLKQEPNACRQKKGGKNILREEAYFRYPTVVAEVVARTDKSRSQTTVIAGIRILVRLESI